MSDTSAFGNGDTFASCMYIEEGDVHYVSSADQLMNIGSHGYYELTADIDLSGVDWANRNNLFFDGVLNGNGYAIKNLSLMGKVGSDSANVEIGLFKSISGVVYDVHFEDAFIMATGKNAAFGLLATTNNGSIINCSIDEKSTISITDAHAIGGFVAINNGFIKNCTNYSNISATGETIVGGIAGHNGEPGSIEGCVNYGSVVLESCDISAGEAGGIVAANGGYIDKCINYGSISSEWRVGGIAGESIGGFISNCVNYGEVSHQEGGGIAGGITGYTLNDMSNCLNFGKITGGYHTAGVLGMTRNVKVSGCINMGEVRSGRSISHDERSTVYENCYGIVAYYTAESVCTINQLNSKEFYTETLGWSEDIWDFSDLDVENGKCPKLK